MSTITKTCGVGEADESKFVRGEPCCLQINATTSSCSGHDFAPVLLEPFLEIGIDAGTLRILDAANASWRKNMKVLRY